MHQPTLCALPSRGAVAITIALLALPSLGRAQPSPANSEQDQELITLSPFEVRAEDSAGYQPKNTNSITGIRQELKNLPFNIEIFGEEMIREIGARDLNSVVEFATNVNGTETDDGLQRTASFRGITSNFTRRNQFIWYNPSDSFSLGRVEIIRGPSSLLYGQGEPGGLINTQSKQAALGRNFASISNSISNWGEFRNTLDINVHAGKRFGVRVAGVYEDSDDWRDELGRKVEGGFVNARFQLTEKTQITAEHEHVKREDTPSGGILMWNPTAAEMTRPADVPQNGNVQLHLLGGLENPAVANGAITKENAQSWSGSTNRRTREWEVYQATLDHQFGDHVAVEIGYNEQQQETSITQNQNFSQLLSPNLTNTSTLDDDWRIEVLHRDNPSFNTVKTLRGRAVFNFDLGPSHHDLVVGGVHRTDYFDFYQYEDRLNNGAATGGAVRPAEVYYIRDGIPDFYPSTPTNPVSTPSALGYVPKAQTRLENEETLKAGYAVLMSRFMDDRVHTLVGYRYDDISKWDIFNDGLQFEGTEGSSSAGVNFAFTPEITGYFNYSESFKAPGAFRTDFNNDALSPAVGSGEELGIKFDLLDKRLSGLLTVFHTDFDGSDTNIGGNSATRNTVDPQGLNGRHGGFFVPADTESKGMELQFTYDVTPAWSITLGYGYADARSKEDVTYQINWNDGYLADANGNPLDSAGNPLMSNGAVVTKADIVLNANGNITNASALGLVGNGETGAKVNQVTGQPTDTFVVLGGDEKTPARNEHNINMLTRYEFRSGPLKGASVGGYARTGFNYIRGYTGSVQAGNRELQLGDDIYIQWGIWAGYTMKFEKVKWTTRVQIDNPFDDEYTLGGYNSEYWNNPRQIRWTNTISF